MKSKDIFRLSLTALLLSSCGQVFDSVKHSPKEKRNPTSKPAPGMTEEPTSKDRGLSLSLNLPSDVKAARKVSRVPHAETSRAPLYTDAVATWTSIATSISIGTSTDPSVGDLQEWLELCKRTGGHCSITDPMPEPAPAPVELPQAQVACFDNSSEALDIAIPASSPLSYNTAEAVASTSQSRGSYYQIGGAVWAAPTLHLRLVSSPAAYILADGTAAVEDIAYQGSELSIPFLCQGQGVIKLSGLSSNRSYSIQAELHDAIGQLRYIGQASVMTVANTVQAAELRMQRVEYGDAQVLLDVIFEDEQLPDAQAESETDPVPPVCLGCLDQKDTEGDFLEFIKTYPSYYKEVNGELTAVCDTMIGTRVVAAIDRITIQLLANGRIRVEEMGNGCNDAIKQTDYSQKQFFQLYQVDIRDYKTLWAKDQNGNFQVPYRWQAEPPR